MYQLLIKIGLAILRWVGKKLENGSWPDSIDGLRDGLIESINEIINHLQILQSNPKPKKKKKSSIPTSEQPTQS